MHQDAKSTINSLTNATTATLDSKWTARHANKEQLLEVRTARSTNTLTCSAKSVTMDSISLAMDVSRMTQVVLSIKIGLILAKNVQQDLILITKLVNVLKHL